MKKISTLLLVLTGASCGLYAQEQPLKQVSTQSNGVVINEAPGIEGSATTPQAPARMNRSISEWSLPECIDALAVVEEKLNMLTSSAQNETDRQHYLSVKQQLTDRRNFLMNTTN